MLKSAIRRFLRSERHTITIPAPNAEAARASKPASPAEIARMKRRGRPLMTVSAHVQPLPFDLLKKGLTRGVHNRRLDWLPPGRRRRLPRRSGRSLEQAKSHPAGPESTPPCPGTAANNAPEAVKCGIPRRDVSMPPVQDDRRTAAQRWATPESLPAVSLLAARRP
jgi:hypothetical protein